MSFEDWTRDLLIFLVTAGVVVPLFTRIRMGTVLGFLIAGVVLGPGGLGALAEEASWLRYITFNTEERVAPFADLGVLFLLFTVGLDLSFARLWAMRRVVLGAGLAQVLLSMVAIAAVVAWFNVGTTAAVIIGIGFAFSSTAITLQLLIQGKRLGSDVGRTTFGILLMQDLMVVPGVILITMLSGDSGTTVTEAMFRGVGLAIAAVVVIVLAGRFVLRPLFSLAAATRSREIVVAIALLVAIGAALATEAAGLSAALGAFLAGLLLATSEYRHQVEVDIEPFKGLLLGLFFMTVGMSVDLAVVWREMTLIAAGVVALLLIKTVIAYAVTRLIGVRHATAFESALLLAGAGEFAFILFTLARREGLLAASDLRIVTMVVAISMLLTPLLAAAGQWWAARNAQRERSDGGGEHDDPGALKGHVIIGGYGRVGEMIAKVLDTMSTRYVAVDLDARRVANARAEGKPVYYGDVGRKELLERLGGDKALGFVVTSDIPVETERTVAMIRAAWPNAKIFARAKDPPHAHRLVGMGATDVVPEATEGSLQLAAHVLIGIGLPDAEVDETINGVRAALLEDLGPEQA
jgi:CPA2 family monovalent cation:H+ antiporter-2